MISLSDEAQHMTASPCYNAGYQSPPLSREPSLSCPIGHGVDRHEGQAMAESDGEDNQPERRVESKVGRGVAGTEDIIISSWQFLSTFLILHQYEAAQRYGLSDTQPQ